MRGGVKEEVHVVVVNPECTVTGHSEEVHSVTFSPDGTRIVSLSRDMRVKMWDAKTGAEVISFVGVHSVQWHDWEFLVTGVCHRVSSEVA